jgi:small subunit ribosomal protein S4
LRHKPVVKMSRRLGFALTPKAVKYFDRRPYPPGQQGGQGRRANGPYKERLLEKQRLRFQYFVSEKQMQRAFESAAAKSEPTGFALIEDLETRLDAMVLRSGFARTIYQARQYVSHGHIQVDGKRIDRPAYRVKTGETIAVRAKSKQMEPFQRVIEFPEVESPPTYLEVDSKNLTSKLATRPARPLIPVVCNEQLVVEYYAR